MEGAAAPTVSRRDPEFSINLAKNAKVQWEGGSRNECNEDGNMI